MTSFRLFGRSLFALLVLVLLANVAQGQPAEKPPQPPAKPAQPPEKPTQPPEKPAQPAAGEYRILKTFEVGGEGGWDYLTVDAEGRRLFVSHATKVVVLDADSGKILGEIADTPGVHGIALAPDLNRGFISSGRGNAVTIFDLKSLKAIGTVPTGENPDAIVYEPTTKRVFAMNGRSKDATVIDAAEGKAAGRIDLGGKPEFAVVDGAGKLFVNLEDKSEILQLDPKELKVVARWPLAPGEEPSGLAIDVKNHRLFSTCGNKMMVVVDSESGKVLATPAIGENVDGAAFDPATGLAFSSNGEGTLTIVHEENPTTFKVIQTVKTQRGARTIALDPKTHNVFLPTAEFGPTSAPTKEAPRPRPAVVPGSFRILVVGK